MSRAVRASAAEPSTGASSLAIVLTLAAGVALGPTAGPASAQSLEREVDRAPDGWVVFEYATDRDVEICENGGMRWGGSWARTWSDRDDCAVGVAQAELRVRDGVVTGIEIGPPSRGRSSRGDTSLGEWGPQEVADYFLELARHSSWRGVAEDAIMAAVIADGVTVWPELDDIARDTGLDGDVRESAVFWLSQVEDERALDALVSILEDSDDPEIQEKAVFGISQHDSPRATEMLGDYAGNRSVSDDLREHAIFWLGQSDGGGEYLRDLYWSVESRSLKEKVIFALSQSSPEENAVEELMEIALGEEDTDLQKSALFWLWQSDDPRVADVLLELIRPRVVR